MAFDFARGARDSDELAAIYDELGPRLYAVAFRLLSKREDAEECVQDLFVALARMRPDERGRILDLRAYLFSSLRHAVSARSRFQSHRERLHAVLARSDEPAHMSTDLLDSRALGRAVQSLPLEQREILALKIDGQLTFAEIAKSMGTSLSTAASRYRYALEKLRTILGDER